MSIEKERIARCVGWLEGFAPAVWAMISTPTGEKLFDASVGDEYEATVRMLREALYAPKCGIVDPMQDSPRPKVTYESVGEDGDVLREFALACEDAGNAGPEVERIAAEFAARLAEGVDK